MSWRREIWTVFLAACGSFNAGATAPDLGAQVWIEPGQKAADVEGWFRTLAEYHMPVARMFIMWRHIEPERDRWDFSLYDRAFDAAAKHGVRVVATFESNRHPPHRGDPYQLHAYEIDPTRERLEQTAIYIRKVVEHFKGHPAIDAWSLTNEASQTPTAHPIAIERFRDWLKVRYGGDIAALNGAWSTDFEDFGSIVHSKWWDTGVGYWPWPAPFVDWHEFWREHLAWWQGWIAGEIRKVDPKTRIHAHAVAHAGNLAKGSLDMPAWRGFSQVLGGSFHPSWTMLGRFTRDQFAHGMTYNCELLRGAAEPNPFWVMELQGGPNIYSGGKHPMVPRSWDIAQWVWTGIGCGAERIIFWCLNSRLGGFEAGEWGMLDYQNGPTERIETAGKIAEIVRRHRDFFDGARPAASPVTILVSLESMTLDAWKPLTDHPARDVDAHLQSVVATHLALGRLGIPSRIKHVHDYPWEAGAGAPRLAILPHARALTDRQCQDIAAFVKGGNRLLATGLSGMYDEYHRFRPLGNFPLGDVFGARVREVVTVEPIWELGLKEPAVTLPAHLWRTEIRNDRAEVIGEQEGKVVAVRSRCGQGEAVWIPSPICLGAWITGCEAYADLIGHVAAPVLGQLPFRFVKPSADGVLTVLENKGRYLTVITNAGMKPCEIALVIPEGLTGEALWGAPEVKDGGRRVTLGPRGTAVVLWGRKAVE